VIGGVLVGIAVNDDHLLRDPPPNWVFDPGVVRERDAFGPAGFTLLGLGGASLVAGSSALIYAFRSPPRATLRAGVSTLAIWF
jgi:hypothetical protein